MCIPNLVAIHLNLNALSNARGNQCQNCNKSTLRENGSGRRARHNENHPTGRFSGGRPLMRGSIHKTKEHHGKFLLYVIFITLVCLSRLLTAVCSWTAVPIPKHMAKIACPFSTVHLIWTWLPLTFA